MGGTGGGLPVLDEADRIPLAVGDRAVVAAGCDAHRAALLLPGADPVREGRRGAHVIELRRRLVEPAAPALAAVHGDDRALVADQREDAGIGRADPHVLVVIAPRRPAQRRPALAAVRG